MKQYTLEILAICAVCVFCILVLFTGATTKDAGFAGSDSLASARVAEITGRSESDFQPPLWQWKPPSPEIESGLFALQAAIGGIIVGWVFGYWKGQNNRKLAK